MDTLGKRLRWCREQHGWSQIYVSKRLGISNMNLSNYERDAREPDLLTLTRLADMYDASLDWLVRGKVDAKGKVDIANPAGVEMYFRHIRLSDKDKQRIRDFAEGMLWDRLNENKKGPAE